MTVLHISSAMTWRGGEQQIAYLISGLADRGIRSIVMTPKDSALSKRKLIGEPKIIRYWKGFSINPIVASKIKKVCKKNKVDLIHIHDSHAHTFTWIGFNLGLKIPAVLSRRVDFPIKVTSHKKYNHPMIKRILCVSQFIKGIVEQSLVDPSNAYTVYSGVDLKRIEHARAINLRKELNLREDTKIIGNIAALADHKDHKTFVLGADQYCKNYGKESIHFVIVGGDDGEKANIEAIIKSKGLEDTISLLGYVSNPLSYLKAFDIFLFTSKMEGLGTSVIDAMAVGLPIITTDAGGLKELIEGEKEGIQVKSGDTSGIAKAVNRMLTKEELSKVLGNKAKLKAKTFSVEKMVENTIKAYTEILK